MNVTRYGFRILGHCGEERRVVDARDAFFGYACCDEHANVGREAYLSAFTFGPDFRELLELSGSCRGFDGACWSPWLNFDIDRDDLDAALRDARRLAHYLVERYRLDDDALLIFYSGSKGFHLGLPTALWQPEPSVTFNRVCRQMAEAIAKAVGVVIDTGIYDKVRPFRAPNSRHPKTSLHKRQLSLDELTGLSLDAMRRLAEKPEPFELLDAPTVCEQAQADWLAAVQAVAEAQQTKAQRTDNGKPTLNRLTLDFIRTGAGEGDRHRLLYSAARNLGEFACPPALAHALLTDAALDCGLPPCDVHRQIECGLKDQNKQFVEGVGFDPVENAPIPSAQSATNVVDIRKQLAALWQSPAPTPAIEPAPEQDEGDDQGESWKPPPGTIGPSEPLFPFGANETGPYGKEGGRR